MSNINSGSDGDTSNKPLYPDPYVDWTEFLSNRQVLHVPIFLQLPYDTLLRFVTLSNEDNGGVKVATSDGKIDARTEFHDFDPDLVFSGSFTGYIYIQKEDYEKIRKNPDQFADLLKGIRDVALPVQIGVEIQTNNEKFFSFRSLRKSADLTPIIGIVDDGIGFLNQRFRYHETSSRFIGIWLQSLERPAKIAQGENKDSVYIGREILQYDIESYLERLKAGESELKIYREINSELVNDVDASARSRFDKPQFNNQLNFSHGTAILDIAAGGLLDELPGYLPSDLLAVQLPPTTLEDTSGTRLDSYLIMGIRWLLYRAQLEDRPIIINLSLGISAGNKTGSKFVERQINQMVDEFNNKFGEKKAQVVIAYGNSYRERLTARFTLNDPDQEPEQSAEIDWVVQPDDTTPSFLHIHLVHPEKVTLDSLQISAVSPTGETFVLSPARKSYQDLSSTSHACLVARAYRDEEEGDDRLTLALGPTAERAKVNVHSPAGRWKIKLGAITEEKLDVIVQVQRGDRGVGFNRGGRQSYLDHPAAYEFDPETQEFEAPGEGNGITRLGTNNALMTRPTTGVYLVGGAMRTGANSFEPTLDTAAGADWSRKSGNIGPHYSAVSEDDIHSPGVIASGTFSNSTVTVSGTSVAAAKLTRALFIAQTTQEALQATSVSQERLGAGVVKVEGGARERHP